jgi:hypothetical protein
MKEILNNIALLNLLDYCKANGIDPSGTHLEMGHPRHYTYTLRQDTADKALVTVTYYKNQRPSYLIHK